MTKLPMKEQVSDTKPEEAKPGNRSGTILGEINDDPKKSGKPADKPANKPVQGR